MGGSTQQQLQVLRIELNRSINKLERFLIAGLMPEDFVQFTERVRIVREILSNAAQFALGLVPFSCREQRRCIVEAYRWGVRVEFDGLAQCFEAPGQVS